uniref:ASCH domain-containing protein n=3 Tax=Clastoptera arizonana TaxID=38151 RepID=A0A1B6C1E5_9HEMI
MSTEWLSSRLSDLLEFPVPKDMTEYIDSITNDRDLEDYLKTLLDFTKKNHKLFFQELLHRRKGKVAQDGYKKSEVDMNYIAPKTDKKKKGKNKNEDIVVEETVESSQPSQDKVKKKTKFVNLYSQEGRARDVILLKGRHLCTCEASKHKLINNCLSCGRIICEQEGSGPCLFCGELVVSREEQNFINTGTKQANQLLQKLMDQKPPGWKAAIEQRDRLLEYDRNSTKRTRVIDDQSDYFSPSTTVWLSQEERDYLAKKEEESLAYKHQSRINKPIKFSLVDGRAVDLTFEYEDFYNHEESLVEDIENNFRTLSFLSDEDDGDIHPSMANMKPKFQESCILEHGSRLDTKTSLSRIQDKEYLEMVDEGYCLSMHQPWASLLVAGIKKHEGRDWYTSHRGRLWIAATSKQPDKKQIEELKHVYTFNQGDELKSPVLYPVSCLLGSVLVTECLGQEEYRIKFPDGESESPFVFICEDPQELPIRFPIQGKPKIYRLDPKIHEAAQNTMMRAAKIRAQKAKQSAG